LSVEIAAMGLRQRIRPLWDWVDSKVLPWVQMVPPLLTRVAMGWVFFESGRGKFNNLEGVTQYFTSLGIPAPGLQAPMVATVELVCGLLLIVGLGTRFAASLLASTMVVAILTEFHAYLTPEKSWSDLFGLAEFCYLLLFTWLIANGGGLLSLDRLVLRWVRCDAVCHDKAAASPAA